MSELRVVGTAAVRVDGLDKVGGAARYVDDLEFGPGLLHAAILEIPFAHALIKRIDVSSATQAPGVVKVVTGRDFPYRFGLYMKDRYIFAQERVRFVGEQVAAVIARDPRAAQRALALIPVEYEPLPAVFDPVDARSGQAPVVHPELGGYAHVPWFYPHAGSNLSHHRPIRKGDVAAGFSEADVVLEDTYRVPRYAHCAIETHVAVGLVDASRRLTVWAASQSPYTQRHLFAEALSDLGYSHSTVRVITPYVGGGFGGKAGVSMEILAAALATAVPGHPVKVRWTRAQEFTNTYMRQAVVSRIKIGARKDGTLTALEMTNTWDAGAYVEYNANAVNASALSATGPYRIPNVKVDSLCVYTNLPPGGPYRGFGYSEMMFGVESHMSRLARKLGISPVDLRRLNALRRGDTVAYGGEMNENGLIECLDRVAAEITAEAPRERTKPGCAIGRGVALLWKAPAMPPNTSSAAFLKFNEDGSLNLPVSGMEIGQGFLTVMAQIASEILTVPVGRIRVQTPDTDQTPYEWQTVASHVTWSCGNAVKRAALEARQRIFEVVHRAFHYETDSLYLEDEKVKCRTDADFTLSLRDFVVTGIQTEDGTYRGGPIMGSGTFMPEFTSAATDPQTGQGGHPDVHYTVGACGVIVEVDRQSGRVRVLKAAEALDAGRAINPELVRQQIVGGFLQGMATALYEDMRFDAKGRLLNASFADYKIPTSLDIPDEVVPIIVEVP